MSEAKNQTSSKTGSVIDFILLRRVLAFAKPYRLQFTMAAIAAISLSFLGPLRPMLINYAIDNYIIIPNKEKLLDITMLLLGLLFLEVLFSSFIFTYPLG